MKKLISIVLSCFLIYSFVCVDLIDAMVMPSQISVSINKDLEITSGKIVDSFLPNTKKPQVVFIQDLHTSTSVQENIAKTIDSVSKKYSLDKIMVEGAPFEKIDTTLLKNISQFNVSKSLLDDGLLSGSEYYFLKYNTNANIFGLEDWNTYLKNIKVASEILEDMPYMKELYNEFQNVLYSKIPQSKKLIKYVKFDLDDNALFEKMNQPILKYISLYQYWNFLEMSKTLNLKKIKKEHVLALQELQSSLSYKEYSNLVSLFKQNKLQAYYTKLYSIIENEEYKNKYNNLYDFLSCNIKLNDINSIELLLQKDSYFFDFMNSSSLDDQTKESLFLLKMTELFESFFTLVITENDYKFFVENYEKYINLLPKYLSQDYLDYNDLFDVVKIFNYHDTNIYRSDIFVNNILKSLNSKNTLNTNIVVTGGFHSSVLSKLRKHNISYLLVSPTVENNRDSSVYNEVIKSSNENSLSTQALAKIPLMLANANVKIPSLTRKIYLMKLIKELSKSDSSPTNVEKIINNIFPSKAKVEVKYDKNFFEIKIGVDSLVFNVNNNKVVWGEHFENIDYKPSIFEKIISFIKRKLNIFQASSMKLNPKSKYSSKLLSVRKGSRHSFLFSLAMICNALHLYNISEYIMLSFAYIGYKMHGNSVKYELKFDGQTIDVFVENGLEQYLTEEGLKEIFSESKIRIEENISYDKKFIFIGFLSKSQNLFEDHLNNGFIGINEGIMQIENEVLKKALIKAGTIHEFSHEIKGPLNTAQRYLKFEERMMYSDIKYIIEYVAKSIYGEERYKEILYTEEYSTFIKNITDELLNLKFSSKKAGVDVPLFTNDSRFIRKIYNYAYQFKSVCELIRRKGTNLKTGQMKYIEMNYLRGNDENQKELFETAFVRNKDEQPTISLDQFLNTKCSSRKKEVDKLISDFIANLKTNLTNIDLDEKKVNLIAKYFESNIDSCLDIMYTNILETWFVAFYNNKGNVVDHAINHSFKVLEQMIDILSRKAYIFENMDNAKMFDFIQNLVYSALLHDISCMVSRENHEQNSALCVKNILKDSFPEEKIDKIVKICLGHKKAKVVKIGKRESAELREEHIDNAKTGYSGQEARLFHDADGLSAVLDLQRILNVWMSKGENFFNQNLSIDDRLDLISRNKYMVSDGGDCINDIVRQFIRRDRKYYLTREARELIDTKKNPIELEQFFSYGEYRDNNGNVLFKGNVVRKAIKDNYKYITDADIDKAVEVIRELLDRLVPEQNLISESVSIDQRESEFNLKSKFNLIKKILRFIFKKYISFEKIITFSDMHGGYTRLTELIYSLFYTNIPIEDAIRQKRESLSEEENISKSDDDILEELIMKELSKEGNDTLFYVLGDMLDRGDKSVQTFQFIKKVFDRGKAKYVMGNHDLYAFLGILGFHLPSYSNYKGIFPDHEVLVDSKNKIKVNVLEFLEQKRKNNSYGVNDKIYWAHKVFDYMSYSAKRQKEIWTPQEKELQKLFESAFGDIVGEKGVDSLHNPSGIFLEDEQLLRFSKKFFGRNVGVTVYTGIRAVDRMSVRWWNDRLDELKELKNKYNDTQEKIIYWQTLETLIEDIISQQQSKLELEYASGNWEWVVVDSIMYRNYESTEWNALDWLYHKNWGEGFIEQRNEQIHEIMDKKRKIIESNDDLTPEQKEMQIKRSYEEEEKMKINQASYLNDSVILELLNFYKQNFYLYRIDKYGICYMHSLLPVDEDGDISIGYVDENGIFQERDENGKRIKGLIYKGKQYKGEHVFEGLEQIAKDIREYDLSSNNLSQISEALTIVTAIYADNTTRIKPANIKQMKKEHGFYKILRKMGVTTIVVGHNPINKLDTSFEYKTISVFGREYKIINVVHIDGNMSPGYAKPKGAGLIRIIGGFIETRGFATGESTKITSSATPDVDNETFMLSVFFNMFPRLLRILEFAEKISMRINKIRENYSKIKSKNTVFIKAVPLGMQHNKTAGVLTEMEAVNRAGLNTLLFAASGEYKGLNVNRSQDMLIDSIEVDDNVYVDVYLKEIKISNNKQFKVILFDFGENIDMKKDVVFEQLFNTVCDNIIVEKYSRIKKYKNILHIGSGMTSDSSKLDTKNINDRILKALGTVFTDVPLLFDVKQDRLERSVLDINEELKLTTDKIQSILSAA